MANDIDFDVVLTSVGEFGRYQRLCYGFICLCTAIGTVPGLVALVFQTYVPDYRCSVPACDNTSSEHFQQSFVNFSIPLETSGMRSRCRRFWRYNLTSAVCAPDQFDSNVTVSCTDFVYDRSMFSSSFVTQWDLTCSYQPLVELPNTLYFSGVLIGSILYGSISDRFGRKPALLISVLMLLFSNCGIALMYRSLLAVCALRILLGMSSCGFFQTAFVISVEQVGRRWRVPCGSIINFFTTLGALAGVGLGYAVRDWLTLQIISTAPLLLLLLCFWVLPESVRWLLTQDRSDEALRIIKKMARWNGVVLSSARLTSETHCDDDTEESSDQSSADENQLIASTHVEAVGSIMDCLRVRTMRLRLVNTLLGWFSVNLAFYGLVTDMQNIPGDFFTNLFITSLAEIPGYALCWVLMDRLGRRSTFVGSTVIGGVSIIAAGITPNKYRVVDAVLLMLGKCGACTSFAVVYIYTSELFPTPARNTAIGLCSTWGRVAAILAPQIANLAVYGESIPLLIIGGASVVAGMFTAFLPETLGAPLPETLQEALDIGKSRRSVSPADSNETSHTAEQT